MERHKCKLCSRSFINGRALGGHMKAHLALLPLPPPKPQQETEDPKKKMKNSPMADPDAGSVVVQDRESETESKNPTRHRFKRNRKSREEEEEEPIGRVSDAEEKVAMCLMMLSMDTWRRKEEKNAAVEEEEETVKRSVVGDFSSNKKGIKFKKVRGKHRCRKCGKTFRTSRALGSHRSICCSRGGGGDGGERVFECPYCLKVFGSGQALGGHKRSHLMGIAPPSPASTAANDSVRPSKLRRGSLIDLNLPAPTEEDGDNLSVVSDA